MLCLTQTWVCSLRCIAECNALPASWLNSVHADSEQACRPLCSANLTVQACWARAHVLNLNTGMPSGSEPPLHGRAFGHSAGHRAACSCHR